MTEKTKASSEFKSKEKKENIIKSIFIIKPSDTKKTIDNKFLGIKRKLFKKTKLNKENTIKKGKTKTKNNLLITKAMEYFINNTNIKNNEMCIICLDKIDFKERHFLHCGHFFHCCCINKWIKMDKNKCPTCKQDIECNKSFEDDLLNEENNNNQNIEINRNNDELLSILFLYFCVILIIFMFKGFCVRVFSVWAI